MKSKQIDYSVNDLIQLLRFNRNDTYTWNRVDAIRALKKTPKRLAPVLRFLMDREIKSDCRQELQSTIKAITGLDSMLITPEVPPITWKLLPYNVRKYLALYYWRAGSFPELGSMGIISEDILSKGLYPRDTLSDVSIERAKRCANTLAALGTENAFSILTNEFSKGYVSGHYKLESPNSAFFNLAKCLMWFCRPETVPLLEKFHGGRVEHWGDYGTYCHNVDFSFEISFLKSITVPLPFVEYRPVESPFERLSLQIRYSPPFLPIKIVCNSDGKIEIETATEVPFLIGSFEIAAKVPVQKEPTLTIVSRTNDGVFKRVYSMHGQPFTCEIVGSDKEKAIIYCDGNGNAVIGAPG